VVQAVSLKQRRAECIYASLLAGATRKLRAGLLGTAAKQVWTAGGRTQQTCTLIQVPDRRSRSQSDARTASSELILRL